MALTFEEALLVELKKISGLSVYPLKAENTTAYPYAVYTASALSPEKHLAGFATNGMIRCEIDVVHSSIKSARTAGDAIIAKIKSFVGTTIGSTGPYIQDIMLDDASVCLYEPDINAYRQFIGFNAFI